MNLKTNGKSVMAKANQKKMSAMSPRQYQGSGGSMDPDEVKSFHNSKGKSLGTTKGKSVKVPTKFTKPGHH